MTKRIASSAITLSLLFAATAFAQSTPKEKDKTRWGVSVGFAPNWKVDERDKIYKLFFTNGEDGDDVNGVNITGYEFRVGVARGRELGSDWSVSFVRRKIDDGSTMGQLESVTETFDFLNPPKTLTGIQGTKNVYRGASMMGLEVNKFFAFATIKQRVQIGLNLGIGIAQFHGVADRTRRNAFLNTPCPGTCTIIVDPTPPVTSVVDAKDLFSMKNVAIGKFMFAVAGILPGSIKVRADFGYSFPGIMMFSLTGTYFFGHR